MAILTRRKKMGLLLIAAAVAAAMVIWTWGAGDEAAATDNAYIRGDVTSLAPKVAGYVIAVEVKDNQVVRAGDILFRSEEHTSELTSLMRISYAVFCLKKNTIVTQNMRTQEYSTQTTQ